MRSIWLRANLVFDGYITSLRPAHDSIIEAFCHSLVQLLCHPDHFFKSLAGHTGFMLC